METNQNNELRPQLEAGSLRKGFSINYEGATRRIQSVDKRRSTVELVFENGYCTIEFNDRLFEIVSTRTQRKVGKNDNRRSNPRRHW